MAIQNKSIKQLHEDDRPREKLLLKGTKALSNAELLAILLGSGNRELNAVQLAQNILNEADNQITTLARFDIHKLQEFKGVGPAKAITILAAMELVRRRKFETISEQIVHDSKSAYQILEPHLSDLSTEEFWVIFLNQKNRVLSSKRFSQGGITSTVVDKRLIIKEALYLNAVSLILGHNHPSGNTKPSSQDLQLTKEIQDASSLMGIRILDHIIITESSYSSLADEGLLSS